MEFNLFYAILTFLVLQFVPGFIISFSVFKKRFSLEDHLFSASFIGVVSHPLIAFLIALATSHFSIFSAVFSSILLYAFSLWAFSRMSSVDELKSYLLESFSGDFKKPLFFLLAILLFLISFWVRTTPASPYFSEVDPYFYSYEAKQVIENGIPPLLDDTAWYPLMTSHRGKPLIAYFEAIIYIMQNPFGHYDRDLLTLSASFYPPLATAIAFGLLYSALSKFVKREYALLASILAFFSPLVLLKTSAGVFEAQPYNFMVLSAFLLYYLSSLRKDAGHLDHHVLSLSIIPAILSSNVAGPLALMFVPFALLEAVRRYYLGHDTKHLSQVHLFVLLGSALSVLLDFIYTGHFRFFTLALYSSPFIAFYAFEFLSSNNNFGRSKGEVLAVISAISLIALFFIAKPFVSTLATVSSYPNALLRTISEQGLALQYYGDHFGVFAKTFPFSELFSPVFSFISKLFFFVLSAVSGYNIPFSEKAPSLLQVFFVLSALSLAFQSLKEFNSENVPIQLFVLLFASPVFLVSLIKAKFLIFSAFLLPLMIAFLFDHADRIVSGFNPDLRYGVLALAFLLSFYQIYDGPTVPVLTHSLNTPFFRDPSASQQVLASICSETSDPLVCEASKNPKAFADKSLSNRYSGKLCACTVSKNSQCVSGFKDKSDLIAVTYICRNLSPYWIETMEWIRSNPDKNMRITSWWDYGHWINYLGEKKTVLRNEHSSLPMIYETAYVFLRGTTDELRTFMKKHDSKYVMFDSQIVFGGGSFGGKYSALNYLSCVFQNRTGTYRGPGQSMCELEQLWETVYIPLSQSPYYKECTISKSEGTKGVVAYVLDSSGSTDQKLSFSIKPKYCLGKGSVVGGVRDVLYELGTGDDLKMHKAILLPPHAPPFRELSSFVASDLLYPDDKIWFENGELVSGYSDAESLFYKSNLYKGFFLGHLDGFDLVYTSPDGNVKIYKMVD